MAHYVQVSDTIWADLVRIQKTYKIDKASITDDVFALIGDLDAVAEQHEDPVVGPIVTPKAPSTRAAVLEPTPNELDELI